MTQPRHTVRNFTKSWVDVALLILIGLVGIGFILFIALTVTTTKPNVPPKQFNPGVTSPPAPGHSTSVHASQSPSKGTSAPRGATSTHRGSSSSRSGPGQRGGTTGGGGSKGGGGGSQPTQPVSHPTPAPTAHKPIVGVTVPPINIPPIIGITVTPINLG